LTALLGGPPRQNLDKARAASPITYVTPQASPFLLMHGDADKVVSLRQSKVLDDALRHAGVESALIVVEGAGHASPMFFEPRYLDQAIAFFDRHLKASSPMTKAMTR
jgi:dipeptidyl aminopeptidase/acylaminoacyl peptidase